MQYFDEDIYIPLLEPGDKIYHYTSANGLMGICDGEFWATGSHFLNDYTEFQIGTNIFIEVMHNNITDNTLLSMLKDRILKEMKRAESLSQYGKYAGSYIISFCLEEDSALLWSEYSKFMGYSLAFDFEKLLAAFSDRFIFHGKVIYDHDEQYKCMERTVNTFLKHEAENNDSSVWDKVQRMNNTEIDGFIAWASVVCEAYNMFFASPFWRKLQNIFGGCCSSILEVIAADPSRTGIASRGPAGGPRP